MSTYIYHSQFPYNLTIYHQPFISSTQHQVNRLLPFTMQSFDAIVVGAGFSGIGHLYQLRQLGLSVKLFEKAPDLGGVWYWNQWPNATSDTPSEVYRYSWDKEDLLKRPVARIKYVALKVSPVDN